MAAIALLWLLSSPPNPLDSSGDGFDSERRDGSGNRSRILTVVFSLLGTFLLIFLIVMWAKCNKRKKNKKAIPIDLGVMKNDRYNKNRKATLTDRVELRIDEQASLVNEVDQLNKNNKKKAEVTTSEAKDDKLNINKRGKNVKKEVEATNSDVKDDQLNIDKRSKKVKKEADATNSNIKDDQLNIDKRGKNIEATNSDVKDDQLNIDKRGKKAKNEAEATNSDFKNDQLNIDKHDKNVKKKTEATNSDIKDDQLNIDKRGKNVKKEAEDTHPDIKDDQLNIDKHGKKVEKEADALNSDVKDDQLIIDKHGKKVNKETNAINSDVKDDQLNIDKHDKNVKKEVEATNSDIKDDELNIDNHGKNVKKEEEATNLNVKDDQLNVDKSGKNVKKEAEASISGVKVDPLNIDDKRVKEEAPCLGIEFDQDKLNIEEHEKKKLTKGHSEKVEKLILQMDEQKPKRYTVEDLKTFTENYKERLGAGGFGDVYKGKTPDNVDIAVKVLKTNITWESFVAFQFMSEVESIYNTHHINVIRLIGFCYEEDNVENSNPKTALIFEYMENGSLKEYLFGEKKNKLELKKLYDIAIGAAKGLAYLHEECIQKMIHFDIKPENILLDSKFTPKVCDFGLAKLYNQNETHFSFTSPENRGTFGYLAPEVPQVNRLTNKCDVYSFGIVLLHMVGRNKESMKNNNNGDLDWIPLWVRDAIFMNELEEFIERDCKIVGEHDKAKAIRACKIGLLCVQHLPKYRPLMSEVVKMLEGADSSITSVTEWPFQNLKSLPTTNKNKKGSISSKKGMIKKS